MKISTDTLTKINRYIDGSFYTAFFISLVNISARAYCVGVTVTDGILGIPRVTVALTPEGAIALGISLGVVFLTGISSLILSLTVRHRRKQQAAEHDAP